MMKATLKLIGQDCNKLENSIDKSFENSPDDISDKVYRIF